MYNMGMKFEWDEYKRRRNIRERKIDFVDVSSVFDGPMVVWLDTRKDYGEDRWIGIGFLRNLLVVVVYTELDSETIRIISVRKADRNDRKIFQNEV
jgi:uncharacterized DUF497 family protein